MVDAVTRFECSVHPDLGAMDVYTFPSKRIQIVCVHEDIVTSVVITRDDAVRLRDWLNQWLEETK